jgi:tetratricopeptide (TPR) repeat protein
VSRLQQLLKFVEEEPHDPFNIYAVALEYVKLDSDKALVYFENLVAEHPDYVASYYTFGKLLQIKNQLEKAKQVFQKGIEKADANNDQKALRELKNALTEIEFDLDEI